MSRHTARARSSSDRTSLYDEITTKIIGELEAGRVPWVLPWGTAAAKTPLAMPKNAATGRFYSGINVLILWGSVIEYGFPVQGWITFRRTLGLGGHVRKGEHGTTVVYADRFVPDDEKKRAEETGEEAQAIHFLKRFTVFNLAQCEGLPENLVATVPPPEPGLIEPKVEALIKATGIDFRIGGCGREGLTMATPDRADVYARITAEIVAAIEAGAGEYAMRWHHDGTATARPVNITFTGRKRERYSSIVPPDPQSQRLRRSPHGRSKASALVTVRGPRRRLGAVPLAASGSS